LNEGILVKAIVCTKYGPPDVLQFKEVEKPAPKDNEVLVKIHAASMNAADFEILRGAWSMRMLGPFRPKYKIPGSDVAGRVEAVGSAVKKFKPGDEVFGDMFMSGFGAFAEYKCAPEDVFWHKPASMTFEEASTYPQAALIALQGLRGKKAIKKGHKVLINGAGGGMGTFGVQIAKYYGAEVTAVDSENKLDILRSLGADHVIDYNKVDYTKTGKLYDLILDVAAHGSVFGYKRVLKPNGIFVIIGGSRSTIFKVLFLGPLITLGSKMKMGLNPWSSDIKDDIDFLIKLFETGEVKPVIDKHYPLTKVPEAYRYLEEGRALGKLVITIAK
jgi:NADPH:quinone reductase-like Zn-dependent oxidoreductase